MIERRKKTSCLFTGMKTVLSSYELACGKCVVLFFFFIAFCCASPRRGFFREPFVTYCFS